MTLRLQTFIILKCGIASEQRILSNASPNLKIFQNKSNFFLSAEVPVPDLILFKELLRDSSKIWQCHQK